MPFNPNNPDGQAGFDPNNPDGFGGTQGMGGGGTATLPYPFLNVKTTLWLENLLTTALSDINTECSQDYSANIPVWALLIGQPRQVNRPTLCIIEAAAGKPAMLDMHEYAIGCAYRILGLIPQAGKNSARDFEMARQIASGYLRLLFLDETKTLQPQISTAQWGTITAYYAEQTGYSDVYPYRLPDTKTVVTGFEITWNCAYAVGNTPH